MTRDSFPGLAEGVAVWGGVSEALSGDDPGFKANGGWLTGICEVWASGFAPSALLEKSGWPLGTVRLAICGLSSVGRKTKAAVDVSASERPESSPGACGPEICVSVDSKSAIDRYFQNASLSIFPRLGLGARLRTTTRFLNVSEFSGLVSI